MKISLEEIIKFSFLLFFTASLAQASETVWKSAFSTPPTLYHWIDPNGLMVHMDFPIQSAWVWKETHLVATGAKEEAHVMAPVLRTWIEVPQTTTLSIQTSTDAQLHEHPSDTPFSNPNGKVYSIDSVELNPSFNFVLKSAPGERRDIALVLLMKPTRPALALDQSCVSMDVGVRSVTSKAEFAYAAISCRKQNGFLQIFLLKSPNALPVEAKLGQKKAEGPGWVLYQVEEPRLPSKSPETVLGTLTLKGSTSGPPLTCVIFLSPSAKKGRFNINPGLSITRIDYQENSGAVKMSEFGLTAKVGLQYLIIPERWTIETSGFLTLLPFLVQPSSMSSSRFIGINGRVGYRLPFKAKVVQWTVWVGGYYWGMLVPDLSYGVKALLGPQVFLSAKTSLPNGHAGSVYAKYAPIGASLGLPTLSNFELALGGSYQISPIQWKRTLSLTLDLSRTQFSSSVTTNNFGMWTSSLGVSTPLSL